jgi:hypothetical protein
MPFLETSKVLKTTFRALCVHESQSTSIPSSPKYELGLYNWQISSRKSIKKMIKEFLHPPPPHQ